MKLNRTFTFIVLYAVLASACIFIGFKHTNAKPKRRNVIFMVSDGMGPAAVTLARNLQQYQQNKVVNSLVLDNHFIGNSRTQSSDSLVTDSAAGATAYSCALKTYNGAIAVDPDGQPCATVLEAAKLAGYKTGLVVTTRLTDATPASFAAHAHDRSEEDFIAEQMVNFGNKSHPFGLVADIMLGGGRCHFLPQNEEGSCRRDERDLLKDAESRGFTVLSNYTELHDLEPELGVANPILGLFASGDLPFSLDGGPSLAFAARRAAELLGNATKNSNNGFFLLVEGSRIDHAGHQNDPGAQTREVLAYDEAFKAMIEYANSSSDETLVVSTSDHETGGLSVARQLTPAYPEYAWYPDVLNAAKHSSEFLSRELASKSRGDLSEHELKEYIRHEILGVGLGFPYVSHEDVDFVFEFKQNSQTALAHLQSLRAETGWATHGHSAVDVNVYGGGKAAKALQLLAGGHENIEIGDIVRQFVGIPSKRMAELTGKLRSGFGKRFGLRG